MKIFFRQKWMMVRLRLETVFVGLIFLSNLSGHAFRAEEEVLAGEEARLILPKAMERRVTPAQRAAAELGKTAGVQVEWHSLLGTPQSIRGANLGARRAYSGGKGLVAQGGNNYEQDAVAVVDNLSRFYQVREAEKEFVVQPVEKDALGFHHVRLKQTHQGLRVMGGDLVVHFDKGGQAYQVTGQYVAELLVELTPRINGKEAVKIAQRALARLGKPAGKLEAPPALVVYARTGEPQLAYELSLFLEEPQRGPGRWRFWVDARQGVVLLRYNDIKKVNPPTANGANAILTGNILTGEGGLSTSVTGWRENNGIFYLHNTNRHWFVFNVATSGYPDNNTYAHRASSDWAASDTTAMSAAKNFDVVQRYYAEVQGRNSFNGAGLMARANIHEGANYVNAYWNGVDFNFGDGDSVTSRSLATLDICGHEFTHAVTEHTADLVYADESGALNESFSDIMGACIEFYAQSDGRSLYPGKSPGTSDWLCGEDAWLSAPALRDLRNPHNSATVGEGNEQPSRYAGTYWYSGAEDNGGVHQNSGVQNFFFYLLSEGGSGTNDGIVYNVAGIGLANAERVAYRALTVYCTPNTDYEMARSAWVSAAMDLNTNWVSQVGAAWSAVGIGALQVTPNQTLLFRGPVGGPFSPGVQTVILRNRNNVPMTWGVASNQTWLHISPNGGVLAPGASNAVTLTVNVAGGSLLAGVYTNRLVFSNSVEMVSQQREAVLLVGQPDYFTEQFDAEENDLSFQRFTFTPDGSASFYATCRETASVFSTDPTGGAPLVLSDDSYVQITLPGTNTISLYGRRTNSFFVGSNGYLTLDAGDVLVNESVINHFNRPRISACFDDLDPSAGGAISWKQAGDRVAITFLNVREYDSSAVVSFQVEMFWDGRIRLTYLDMEIADGLTGLSAGWGLPAGFAESDFRSYGPCAPMDTMMLTPGTGLAAAGDVGGPFSPASALYTLGNGGTNTLPWRAVATQPWVTVNPVSGSVAAGTSAPVSITINSNAQSLASGVYNANVTFSNLVTGFTLVRSVSLQAQSLSEPIFYFPLDTNPGWGMQGGWAFGVPWGAGSHNLDPASGHTGANVLGYNLAGDYSDNLSGDFLTTTALDCSNYEDVRLTFWRWLGVESADFDHASIEVSTNNVTWFPVWEHNGFSALADMSWQEVSYDISAVADRSATVYLRWKMGATDGDVTYPGWNLDDISLTGRSVDSLRIRPAGNFVAQGEPEGVFSPASKNYAISNASPLGFGWTVMANQPWLTVFPANGYLAAGGSNTVVAQINTNASSLGSGIYFAQIIFSNAVTGIRQTRGVELTIGNSEAESVSLPIQLLDGSGYRWDIQVDGSIADGSNDAYDGGHVLLDFSGRTNAVLQGGREVTIGPLPMNGLQVTRRIYVPKDQAYARFLEVLHNPTGNAVTMDLDIYTDLGSDFSTVLLGSSSGDANFDVNDNWVVTDDANDAGDPVVLHVIANDYGVLRPADVSYHTNDLSYHYSVTVPPGETQLIMHFGAQAANPAGALAKAAQLAALELDALAQISPLDLARIVNFRLPCYDCPPVIVTSPAHQTVATGNAAIFQVLASGSQPLFYQWRSNGVPILSATTDTLSLSNVQANQNGDVYGVLVTNAYGTAVSSNAILTVVSELTLGQAVDAPELTWTTGGDATWVPQTSLVHDGIDAARSGLIDDDSQTWLQTTVTGPGTLRFWWKVSSEGCCDPFDFLLDGFSQAQIIGEMGWRQETISIAAGNHTLRWVYTKDGSVVEGSDAAWLDQVSYVPAAGVLHHLSWGTIPSSPLVNTPFAVSLTAQDNFSNPVTNFAGPVSLNAVTGGNASTNTLLNNLTHSEFALSDSYSDGYAFTPNANLQVTHVRHYYGEKVTIWSEWGDRLASQNVFGTPGVWQETALDAPVILLAGIRYRVTIYYAKTNIFWADTNITNFAHGTIDFGCYAEGDAFPDVTFAEGVHYLVDLRYAVAIPVFVSPVVSGAFSNGFWSGSVTVPAPGADIHLIANDGAGHFGVSNPFNVSSVAPPILGVSLNGVNTVLSWPASISAQVEVATNLIAPVMWAELFPSVVQTNGQNVAILPVSGTSRFYRLRID